jgi:hypothetical protein
MKEALISLRMSPRKAVIKVLISEMPAYLKIF